jgi:hypothetical protein
MARKSLVILFIAAFAAVGSFAQENFSLSAGAGGLIGGDFGGGIEAGSNYKMEMPYFGGGGFLFFDATYAELSFGILAGGGTVKTTFGGNSTDTDTTVTNLNIGILGKYPVAINENLYVFPLLGIDYQITLSRKDSDGNEYKNPDGDESPGDFSALWFKLGCGLDYDITSNVYARFEALYGLRLANKMELDAKDSLSKLTDDDVTTRLGHGLNVKLAIGYKF